MAVITVSRQLGSLGFETARLAAERLDYSLVQRELINQAAHRAGTPEVALAAIDELGLLGVSPSITARRAYARAVQQVMEELAAKGRAVIIGRAGQVILRNHPDAFHVRVIAPTPLRVERVADQQNIPPDRALAQVEASDQFRRKYLRRYYHARWDDPELYDLVINTARLSPDEAAGLICQAFTSRTAEHSRNECPSQHEIAREQHQR